MVTTASETVCIAYDSVYGLVMKTKIMKVCIWINEEDDFRRRRRAKGFILDT